MSQVMNPVANGSAWHSQSGNLKIAFTYDRRKDWLALGFTEDQCHEFEDDATIEAIAAALRKLGTVEMIGGLKSLTMTLATSKELNWDIVFNICEGYGSIGREAQVPALLDAWGINYTFSDAATLALCLDKSKTKMVIEHYGIPTAAFACVPPRSAWNKSVIAPGRLAIENSPHCDSLRSFPLFVKPSSVSTGLGIGQTNKVKNSQELEDIVEKISMQYPHQTILIEKFLCGREFTVGLVGTERDAKVLGVRELVFLKGNQGIPIDASLPYTSFDPSLLEIDVYGHDLKRVWCPNPQYANMDMSDPITSAVGNVALQAWKVLGCRDGGRIDIRHDTIDHNAIPNFIEVNPIAGLAPDWSDLPQLAKANGVAFEELIKIIVDSAMLRHTTTTRGNH